MLKLKLLDKDIELKLVGKGEGACDKTLKMYHGAIDNEPIIAFDNSDEQFGIAYISVEDLVNVIDKLASDWLGVKPTNRRTVIGQLNKPWNMSKIGIIPAGYPIYEGPDFKGEDKYWIVFGNSNIPVDRDYLKKHITFNEEES